ncbi:putative retrotransposon protein [Klebsormidium nitens]|uniref:RNA-directed DNA polymerase n=1 Tax=Klebsormidium nitens TaxID=105231 RepID=A0A1Y1IMQ4_KLENI|nr:putative retrotransposon protein [Klebsormidium nitens]|eukprot:GAQ92084.1 putative retrotransposon protein [Klebsormidium nitens]
MASSAQMGASNVPTVTGTFPVAWVPTDTLIQHGSPSMVSEIASTARKAGQSLARQGARRLVPASTIRKVEGGGTVERVFVDPLKKTPIAFIPVRIGGVDALRCPRGIDSGADVNVMAFKTMMRADLGAKFRKGKPTFTGADGRETVAIGWVDTLIGMGSSFELGSRFIVQDHINYDLLLGTTSMRAINGHINFEKERFEFQLPYSKRRLALPLVDPRGVQCRPRVSVATSSVRARPGARAPARRPRSDRRTSSLFRYNFPDDDLHQAPDEAGLLDLSEFMVPHALVLPAAPWTDGLAENRQHTLAAPAQNNLPDDAPGSDEDVPPLVEAPEEQLEDPEEERAADLDLLCREELSGEATDDDLPDLLPGDSDSESEDEESTARAARTAPRRPPRHVPRRVPGWRFQVDMRTGIVSMMPRNSWSEERPSNPEGHSGDDPSPGAPPDGPSRDPERDGPSEVARDAAGSAQNCGQGSPPEMHPDNQDEPPPLVGEESDDEEPDDYFRSAELPARGSDRSGVAALPGSRGPAKRQQTPLAHPPSAIQTLAPKAGSPSRTGAPRRRTGPGHGEVDESDIEWVSDFNGTPQVDQDYTFGIMFRSMHEVRRLLDHLLTLSRISSEEYEDLSEHYHHLFRGHDVDEVCYLLRSDLLPLVLGKGFRVEVLPDDCQEPARSDSSPPDTVRVAATLPTVEAAPLPRLSDEEQWRAVEPQLQLAASLSPDEKARMIALLRRYPHAFSKDPGDLGLVRGIYHRIDTGDHPPIRRAGRLHSPFEKEEIDKQVDPMEAWHVIRRSTSPYAQPVVLARKKNGKWRFCVDYRALNKATVPNRFPLPRISEIFDRLGEARYFTTLDAQAGYWQIPVHPDDVHKTAFLTHRGLYEFLRMPFGLTGAPGTYQLMMDELLKEEIQGPDACVTQYLDDTLLYTSTFDAHLAGLERVLQKVITIDLKLCPGKSRHFGARETEHLGHLVTHNLLLPAPKKVRAIRDWIDPINPSEIRSFLGMAGYYRHFIKDFAKIARPLHELTKDGVPFRWEEAERAAFQALKDSICAAQGLARPDFNKPFILDTDYSRLGIGATLSQLDGADRELPVAFASRALHGAEANYSTTDGELLAIVWAVTVRFRSYLYGGPTFLVRVDHSPLVWLHQQTNLTGRLARWHIRLMEFNFRVEYRPGRVHSNVDPLSRNPVAQLPWEEASDLEDMPAYVAPDLSSAPGPICGAPTVRMLRGSGPAPDTDTEDESFSPVWSTSGTDTSDSDSDSFYVPRPPRAAQTPLELRCNHALKKAIEYAHTLARARTQRFESERRFAIARARTWPSLLEDYALWKPARQDPRWRATQTEGQDPPWVSAERESTQETQPRTPHTSSYEQNATPFPALPAPATLPPGEEDLYETFDIATPEERDPLTRFPEDPEQQETETGLRNLLRGAKSELRFWHRKRSQLQERLAHERIMIADLAVRFPEVHEAYNRPFILDTDYSRLGIGATLSQLDGADRELPVAFASRALHGAEANYSTTDGELLAIVWAVTVRFRSYLYGRPTFLVRVDHNPLVWLHQQTNLTGRLARWHIRLMEFNFRVEYRPGRVHSNVDPLLRNPVAQLPWEEASDLEDMPAYVAPDLSTAPGPICRAPTVRMLRGSGPAPDTDTEDESFSPVWSTSGTDTSDSDSDSFYDPRWRATQTEGQDPPWVSAERASTQGTQPRTPHTSSYGPIATPFPALPAPATLPPGEEVLYETFDIATPEERDPLTRFPEDPEQQETETGLRNLLRGAKSELRFWHRKRSQLQERLAHERIMIADLAVRFPEKNSPRFRTAEDPGITPPTHPTVRMVLSVRDAALSEGAVDHPTQEAEDLNAADQGQTHVAQERSAKECSDCGKAGHFFADCQTKPAKKRVDPQLLEPRTCKPCSAARGARTSVPDDDVDLNERRYGAAELEEQDERAALYEGKMDAIFLRKYEERHREHQAKMRGDRAAFESWQKQGKEQRQVYLEAWRGKAKPDFREIFRRYPLNQFDARERQLAPGRRAYNKFRRRTMYVESMDEARNRIRREYFSREAELEREAWDLVSWRAKNCIDCVAMHLDQDDDPHESDCEELGPAERPVRRRLDFQDDANEPRTPELPRTNRRPTLNAPLKELSADQAQSQKERQESGAGLERDLALLFEEAALDDAPANTEVRSATIQMVQGSTGSFGPAQLDLEQPAQGTREALEPAVENPAVAEALEEIRGQDLDPTLGWDIEDYLRTASALREADLNGSLENEESLDAAHELRRKARFIRNGGDAPFLEGTTALERVALSIMISNPDAEEREALRQARLVLLNLETHARDNLEENVLANLEEGPESEVSATEASPHEDEEEQPEFDIAHSPLPRPLDYLINDDEVALYLFERQYPDLSGRTPSRRKEARRGIRNRAKQFQVRNGRLYVQNKAPRRRKQVPGPTVLKPVLTAEERDLVMKQIHDRGGHPSIPNTLKLIRDMFWWKGITEDVTNFVRGCPTCQPVNQPTRERTDGRTLTSTEVDLPLERVGVDLLGPFPPTPEGYTYVYLWHDYFSGWVGAGLGKTKQSKEVAAWAKMDLFAGHACPATAVMDNDLYKDEVKELFDAMGTQVTPITPFAPWQNGAAESSVKILTKNIRKLALDHGQKWAENFFLALLIIRICFRTATRALPFEIIYGRQPVLPSERLLAAKYMIGEAQTDEAQERAAEDVTAAVSDLTATRRFNILLRQAHQANLRAAASANRDVTQVRSEAAYRRRQHRGVYRVANLTPGQVVIMRKNRREHKLDAGWEGPYFFRYFYDDSCQIAVIEDAQGLRWTRHIVLLFPYQPRGAVRE